MELCRGCRAGGAGMARVVCADWPQMRTAALPRTVPHHPGCAPAATTSCPACPPSQLRAASARASTHPPGCAPRPPPQTPAKTCCAPPGQGRGCREAALSARLVQRATREAGGPAPALLLARRPLAPHTSQAKGLFFRTSRLPGTASRIRAHTESTYGEGEGRGGVRAMGCRQQRAAVLLTGSGELGRQCPPAAAQHPPPHHTHTHPPHPPTPTPTPTPTSCPRPAALPSPARPSAGPPPTSGVCLARALKEPNVTNPFVTAGKGATGGASGGGV